VRCALRRQVDVAGRDLEWARDFAVHQPASGAPAEMVLNRWLPVGGDLTVLAGRATPQTSRHRREGEGWAPLAHVH
jgi:hypothetical protein